MFAIIIYRTRIVNGFYMTFCMSFLSVHLATYCALVLKKKKKERQKDDNDDEKAKDGAMKMDDHADKDDHNPKFYYK